MGFVLGSLIPVGVDDQWRLAEGTNLNPKSQSKCSTMEKECFGVIDALKVYRQYLLEREFEVFTDHYFLTWLLARIKEHSGRLWRWVEKLREFQCKVHHIAGRKNTVADALSRVQGVTADVQEVLLDDNCSVA